MSLILNRRFASIGLTRRQQQYEKFSLQGYGYGLQL